MSPHLLGQKQQIPVQLIPALTPPQLVSLVAAIVFKGDVAGAVDTAAEIIGQADLFVQAFQKKSAAGVGPA